MSTKALKKEDVEKLATNLEQKLARIKEIANDNDFKSVCMALGYAEGSI